jgi:hypothetical protein
MVKLNLYVYVLGLGNPFRVDIQRSKDVYDLKKDILRERPNALKDIDAAELVLYKTEVPLGEDLEQLVPQAARQKLGVPSSELSEIFPKKPRAKVVSILVEVPVISE